MEPRAEIRPLESEHLELMVEWAATEGWNPGRNDAKPFRAADPGGFLGLFLDDELTVTVSIVRYDDSFAFAGCYICRPERRGEGLGLELALAAMERAADVTTVGLDGVLEQAANYGRLGFVTEHHSVRYGAFLSGSTAPDPRVQVIGRADVARVERYEERARVFPAPRPAFLAEWLDCPGHVALACCDGDDITGYGVIRPCREGHKIGPLFCDGPIDAERLIGALSTAARAQEVFLDVPGPNRTGNRLAHELGMAPVFEVARMYRGRPPQLDLERVFGITTFELG